MLINRISRSVLSVRLLDVGKVSVQQPQTYVIKRYFIKYMNRMLNLFDHSRLEEVGGERLCAEWVLKCGGRLRWSGSDEWLSDYNNLPSEKTTDILTIRDIDVSGTVVMTIGFKHLWHVKDLKSFKMHDCKYLDDESLKQLGMSTNASLQHLQVSANRNITDTGLLHLIKLVLLTDLHLKDLPAVKDKAGTLEKLQKALPKCDILFPDIDGSDE